MSEDYRTFCKIAKEEEESEIVNEEEGVVAFHSIGGESLAEVLVNPEEHGASPAEIGRLSEGGVKNMAGAESGYSFDVSNGSDVGQEIFLHLHAHVMVGRKWERL